MKFIFFTLSCLIIFSCSDVSRRKKVSASNEIEFAENFKIEYKDKLTIITLTNPKTKVDDVIEIKNNFQKKIISLSSTTNGMISALGAQSELTGISSEMYLYDSILIQKSNKGEIQEFGDESNTSLEKIIQSGANIVLYSGFNSEFPNNDKLKQLGIITIPIFDWREKHPLGKAEWIKVLGAILGKETEAADFFNNVRSQYLNLTKKEFTKKPTVLSGHLYNDIWYAPYGNSYMGVLFEDAGAKYVYADDSSTGTASLQYSLEKVLGGNQETRFWINPGSKTVDEILQKNVKLQYLPAIKNTYCYSKEINKYWERSAIEPHLLLNDLIKIFHSKNPKELYFYSKID